MKKAFNPNTLRFVFFVAIAIIVSCNNKTTGDKKATLVVRNASIWTGNPASPEAEAIAVADDKIIFVGRNDSVQNFIDDKTNVIDANGMMMTPGFIDSHVHMSDGGSALASVQLRDANTKHLFIRRIAEFAKTVPHGVWITGGNWDHTLWGGELPEAKWVDSVTPNNPLMINRLDGHMILANTLAMRAAKVDAQTKDVEGGVITRDAKRNPLGIFKDNAQDLIYDAFPELSDSAKDKGMIMAMDLMVSNGVTSVHNMGTWDDVKTFRRLKDHGQMKIRIYANVPLRTWNLLATEVAKNGTGDSILRIGGLKGFVDGSLGSHTAAMLEPYTDNPKDKGIFITAPDSLYYFISNADKKGLHVMVHAIGDSAIRCQLNIYERVEKENGIKDRRFRIEHAQHVSSQDLSRFVQLKVIPSMQPYHAIDDGRWAEKVIGHERCKTTYAFKSFFDSGAEPAFGSDWFVAPPVPLYGIYAAVTRRTLDDENPNGWFPEQKISVEQALKAYTYNAAYASFEEKQKGTLEIGKLADFVLLQQDIRKIPAEKIRDVKVVMTVVGGKIVYESR